MRTKHTFWYLCKIFLWTAIFSFESFCILPRLKRVERSIKIAYEKIIGMDQTFPESCRILRAFFTPDDKIRELMIGLIAAENNSISGALYLITDSHIIKELGSACQRGVSVELVVDAKVASDTLPKIELLKSLGVTIREFSIPYGSMHNKFFLFNKNLAGHRLLVTGSANPTQCGTTRNQENIIVTNDPDLWALYLKKFEELRKKAFEKNDLSNFNNSF